MRLYDSNVQNIEVCGACSAMKRTDKACPACGLAHIFREAISEAQYFMGRDITHSAELPAELRSNARQLLIKVNSLATELALEPTFRTFQWAVTSGWRPASLNAALGGAVRSRHMTCQAIDVADTAAQMLGIFLAQNQHLLRSRGMAIEDPASCSKVQPDGSVAHWVHLQWPPPRSGNTVFKP